MPCGVNCSHHSVCIACLKGSRQSPRLELQHDNTTKRSSLLLHNIRLATPRILLSRKRSLIPLGTDEFGGLVLRTRLLNERDEISRIPRTDTLLEQLDEIAHVDAFFGNSSLDFFQRRQGDTRGRSSAGSRGGAKGSAFARRARAMLEVQCFLLRRASARCIGFAA
jgi:hypothetical protein